MEQKDKLLLRKMHKGGKKKRNNTNREWSKKKNKDRCNKRM